MYKIFTESRKRRFVMRISFIYIFLLINGIQLLMASNSRGQGLEDIMVTVEVNDSDLEPLLKKIERQTELTFAYLSAEVSRYKNLALKPGRQSVKSVLEQALQNTDLTYRYIENSIIIFPEFEDTGNENDNSLGQISDLEIQKRKSEIFKKKEKRIELLRPKRLIELTDKRLVVDVLGSVVNNVGEPLIGVNVLVKGTDKGTATDFEGNFTLEDVDENAVLVVSYIGYQTKEVSIDGEPSITITLLEDSQTLDEVVVVGYGTQKKVNLTGSVTQISGEKLEDRVLNNPLEGLQGQVPGLNISAGSQGGRPGSNPEFNIRGVGSLSGGSPFVIVDGVPQDLNTVDPQSIESISVLKGPSASAIYGARAPYGVILITTKQGVDNEGSFDFSYNTHFGWNTPTIIPEKSNSVEWAQTLNQAALNGGQSRLYSDETIQRMEQYISDPTSVPGTKPSQSDPNVWDSFNGPDLGYGANANTDLYDVVLKPWAMNQTHNLSIRGGTKSIGYYLGGSLFNRNGQMRFTTNSFNRYNLTLNSYADVTKWLRIDINTKFTNRNTIMPTSYGGGSGGRHFFEMARRPPNLPVYDPNGYVFSRLVNTLLNGGKDNTIRNTLIGSFRATINPLPGWEIHGDFSSSLDLISMNSHKKAVAEYAVDESSYLVDNTYPTEYEEIKNENIYKTINAYTSYEVSLSDHFLKGILGVQTERSRYSNLSGRRTDLISDFVPSLSTANGIQYAEDAKGHWATDGYFGRLQYNFDERYLIEFNGRYDGSSRFEEDKRWGFFPSLSIGYNIANEFFWNDLKDKINLLKIRGSFGSLGNHAVPNYLYLSTLNVNLTNWVFGTEQPIYITSPELISTNLTWEKAKTIDIGLDVEMLDSRFSLTFDWFQRQTLDMFGPASSYPSVLGTAPPRLNNANMRTRGYELSLGWRDQFGESDIYYNLNFMLSDNQSVVTKYRNENGLINDFYDGKTLGEIWGYTTEGLYSSDSDVNDDPTDQSFIYPEWRPGDVNYLDLNGDGKVDNGNQTLDNPGDLSIIGNSSPRYMYSFILGLDWKGLSLSTFWQGVGKRDIWLNGAMFWGAGTGSQPHRNGVVLKDHLNYWRSDNTDAYYPIAYLSSENDKNTQVQTRYLQDASYLRLKNTQVKYAIPQSTVRRIGLNKLQVFFTGENLLTFSSIMRAFDPEATGSGPTGSAPGQIYPLAKTFSIGLNVNF